MTVKNLEMVSGDDVVVQVEVYDEDTDLPVNLTGCSGTFALADFWTSETILAKFSDYGGVEISDPLAGRVDVNMVADDTDALEGEFKYELELTDTLGNKTTPLRGTFTIVKDIIV